MDYILVFNTFELIIMLVGLSIRNVLYEVVLSPLAMSFIVLMIIFKLVEMVLGTAERKEDPEIMTGKFYLKLVFVIIVMGLLLFQTPIRLMTVHIQKNIDTSKEYSTFYPEGGEYTISFPGYFDFSKTPRESFGNSWFSVENFSSGNTFNDIFTNTPLASTKYRASGTEIFEVKLPVFIAFPIILIDKIIHGNISESGDYSRGILHNIFGNLYPLMIAEPGVVFDLIRKNSHIVTNAKEADFGTEYSQYIKELGSMTSKANYNLASLIQSYNNLPYNLYLKVRTGEKDTSGQWQIENYQSVVDVINRIETYNNDMKSIVRNMLSTMSSNDSLLYVPDTKMSYINDKSILDVNTNGEQKNIYTQSYANPLEISESAIDGSGNKLYYPIYPQSHVNAFVTNSARLWWLNLNITPQGQGLVDQTLFESDNLNNEYKSLRSLPSNLRDNQDILKINTGETQFQILPTLYINNQTDQDINDNAIIFNLYQFYLPKLGIGNNVLVKNNFSGPTLKESIHNIFMQELLFIRDQINNVSTGATQLNYPSSVLSEYLAEKKLNSEYDPNGGASNLNQYLNYQYETYFNYYFPSVQQMNNIPTSFYISNESKLPPSFLMYKKFQEIHENLKQELDYTTSGTSAYELLEDIKNSMGSTGLISESDFKVLVDNYKKEIESNYLSYLKEYEGSYEKVRSSAQQAIKFKQTNLWVKDQKQLVKNNNTGAMDSALSRAWGNGFDCSFDVPYFPDFIRNAVCVLLELMLSIFGFLFTMIMKLLVVGLAIIFKLVYGVLYSLHSIGMLQVLVLFPLFFVKSILTLQFNNLYKPFKNYLSYRMWDFSILLIIMVSLLIVPVLLMLFYTFHPILARIMELLLMIGIFKMTTFTLNNVTQLIGGDGELNKVFSSTGRTFGKTAVRGATTLASVGAAVATNVAAKGGGSAFQAIKGSLIPGMSSSGGGGSGGSGRSFHAANDSKTGSFAKGLSGDSTSTPDKNSLFGSAVDKVSKSKVGQGASNLIKGTKEFSKGVKENVVSSSQQLKQYIDPNDNFNNIVKPTAAKNFKALKNNASSVMDAFQKKDLNPLTHTKEELENGKSISKLEQLKRVFTGTGDEQTFGIERKKKPSSIDSITSESSEQKNQSGYGGSGLKEETNQGSSNATLKEQNKETTSINKGTETQVNEKEQNKEKSLTNLAADATGLTALKELSGQALGAVGVSSNPQNMVGDKQTNPNPNIFDNPQQPVNTNPIDNELSGKVRSRVERALSQKMGSSTSTATNEELKNAIKELRSSPNEIDTTSMSKELGMKPQELSQQMEIVMRTLENEKDVSSFFK